MSREDYKMYENIYVRNAIHVVVASERVKISDFVRQTIHKKGLSYRKVADKSGGLITHSTVSDVVNERVTNLSSQTISGLAKGLGVTEQEVFDIVRGKQPNKETKVSERFELLSLKFGALKPSKQSRAEVLVDVLDRELERMANEPDDE